MSNMFNFLADGSSDDEDDTPKRQIKPVAIPKSKPVPAKANSAPKKDGGNNRDTGRSNNRDRGGRGNGKGNRGKGKGKGGRGGDRERRPRREFDRRSGTGRSGPGAEQRKDGAGKGNWGSDADMMNSASQDQQAVANELEQDGATAEEQEPEEPEEEDNELTLEEYQAQLAAKNTGDAFKTLKARKVDTDFEGAAVLKKGEEEEFLGGKEKNLRKKKTQKKKGTAMELKINFARSDSDGGGGGGKGKGKGKGKGNRGGDRDNFRGGKGGGKGKGKGGGNAPPQQMAKLTGHNGTVSSLDVCDERKQLFSGSIDGTVKVWSWENGNFNCVNTVQAGAPVECILVFAPWLFAGTAAVDTAAGSGAPRNGVVRAWNMDTGFEQSLEGHVGSIYCLAQGGAYLFSGGDDAGIKTWQYANEKFEPLIELKGHTQPVQVMKTAAGILISADRSGTVAKWSLESGALQSTFATGHTNLVMSMWVEETYLFTASLDGHVKVWDGDGGLKFDQLVTNQSNAPSGVTSMIVVPEVTSQGETSVLVTACDDKALKLWMMPTFDKRGILASRVGHSDVCRCMARGPGNSFFSGSMDNTIIVWEFMAAG